MSRRSNITRLPAVTRQLLDRALEKSGFGDLQRIADEFKARGWKVSRSALHRYARKKRELAVRAELEVEILKRLDPTARFLIDWARREPKAAQRLVRRLQKQEQQLRGDSDE